MSVCWMDRCVGFFVLTYTICVVGGMYLCANTCMFLSLSLALCMCVRAYLHSCARVTVCSTGEQHERDVAYDNEGYRWDEADGDVEITGVLVHEIDGVKTYRSAVSSAHNDVLISIFHCRSEAALIRNLSEPPLCRSRATGRCNGT